MIGEPGGELSTSIIPSCDVSKSLKCKLLTDPLGEFGTVLITEPGYIGEPDPGAYIGEPGTYGGEPGGESGAKFGYNN